MLEELKAKVCQANLDLVRQARKHIEDGDFLSWKDEAVRKVTRRL